MVSFFFFYYSNANEDLTSYLVAVLGWEEAILSAVFTRDGCSGSTHELLPRAWGLRRLGEAGR